MSEYNNTEEKPQPEQESTDTSTSTDAGGEEKPIDTGNESTNEQ